MLDRDKLRNVKKCIQHIYPKAPSIPRQSPIDRLQKHDQGYVRPLSGDTFLVLLGLYKLLTQLNL